jgi:isopenicillin-N epimerase
VLVFADGAHVPGQLQLDIPALGVDWYGANLHKWAWAPRSCGILWTAPEHQALLHAPIVSWGLDRGMAAEFGFMGTRDLSPFLAAPFAFELLDEFGGSAVLAHNHELVRWAAQHVSAQWDTEFTTADSMLGAMATVRLPARLGATEVDARRVRAELLDAGFDVPVADTPVGLTTRLAAQIYCERDDFARLADAVDALGAR